VRIIDQFNFTAIAQMATELFPKTTQDKMFVVNTDNDRLFHGRWQTS
jgi:hypothetical protein